MFCCYILYSEKIDKYYIGSTSNIEGRLYRHNTSGKGFTSTGKPWVIKYFEGFETKRQAIQREMQLKKWKDRHKLEELIMMGSEHPGLTGRVGGSPDYYDKTKLFCQDFLFLTNISLLKGVILLTKLKIHFAIIFIIELIIHRWCFPLSIMVL